MQKKKGGYRKVRFRKLKKAPPGSAPGQIHVAEGASRPVTTVISFDQDNLNSQNCDSVDEISNIISRNPAQVHWIEIKGTGDKLFFENLARVFNIHRLEIEDVLSGHQRPKVEDAEGHLFLISRMIGTSGDDEITDEQVAFFLFPEILISIQENSGEYFVQVKERLKQNKGLIRKSGASYLAYALMDSVVDNYFPFLEKLGNHLDDLEDKLLTDPDRYSMQNIQDIKRKLILFRRAAWAEREKLNEVIRNQSTLFSDLSRRYLRDTYDHTIQIMDITDSYREITASLMDIYLSSVSNRMNKVMKVLTIIATIFIPLTFIVGVYGMNFVFENPETGEKYPWNMPELHSPYGYITVMVLMALIVVFQIYYFQRKGWLGKDGI
jgi:magnesium transporter